LEDDLILHHPVQEEMVVDVPDVDDVEEVLDDEEEEEIFTKKYTFAELDNESVKLVSFPDMKTKIEGKLCCKICAKKKELVTSLSIRRHTNSQLYLPLLVSTDMSSQFPPKRLTKVSLHLVKISR